MAWAATPLASADPLSPFRSHRHRSQHSQDASQRRQGASRVYQSSREREKRWQSDWCGFSHGALTSIRQPPRYNMDEWDTMMMERDRRLTGRPRGQSVRRHKVAFKPGLRTES